MNKILIAMCALWPMVGNAQELVLRGENFGSDEGKAFFMIYRKTDDMPKTPFKTITVDIVNGKASASVELLYGEYAIILLHDKNKNGKVDHSFGLPGEPMGYSNGWKLTLFSGMPSFDKLKFTFSNEQAEQTISISYKK